MGDLSSKMKEQAKQKAKDQAEKQVTAAVVGGGGGVLLVGGGGAAAYFHFGTQIVQGSMLFPPGPFFQRIWQLFKTAPETRPNEENLMKKRINEHPKKLKISVDETLYANIGLFKDGTGFYGTGMLFQKRFMLTCAHNFYRDFSEPYSEETPEKKLKLGEKLGELRKLDSMWIDFHSVKNSKPKITRKIKRIEIHEQYENHLTGHVNDLQIRKQHDFALVELDEEIQVDKEISIQANLDVKNIAVYGFPKQYGDHDDEKQKDGEQQIYGEEGQKYELPKKVNESMQEKEKSNTIYYTTGTNPGASGAPLLVKDQISNQYKCVGIHTNFNNHKEIQLNQGIYIDTAVMKMIQELKIKIKGPPRPRLPKQQQKQKKNQNQNTDTVQKNPQQHLNLKQSFKNVNGLQFTAQKQLTTQPPSQDQGNESKVSISPNIIGETIGIFQKSAQKLQSSGPEKAAIVEDNGNCFGRCWSCNS